MDAGFYWCDFETPSGPRDRCRSLQQQSPELLRAGDGESAGEVLAHVRRCLAVLRDEGGEDGQLFVEEALGVTIRQHQDLREDKEMMFIL